MATGTAVQNYHGTLTIDTVDTVTLSQSFAWVKIFNRASTGDIFVTTDGLTAPTVGGAETFVVAAAASEVVPVRTPRSEYALSTTGLSTVVKLICHTANAYSVEGA